MTTESDPTIGDEHPSLVAYRESTKNYIGRPRQVWLREAGMPGTAAQLDAADNLIPLIKQYESALRSIMAHGGPWESRIAKEALGAHP